MAVPLRKAGARRNSGGAQLAVRLERPAEAGDAVSTGSRMPDEAELGMLRREGASNDWDASESSVDAD